MRTWAALTTLVITATHKPARTPMPIASAVMPNSLARNRARTIASAISTGRGTEISRTRRRGREPMCGVMRGGACAAKGARPTPA